jgi:uncharacterized membrane protein YgcG
MGLSFLSIRGRSGLERFLRSLGLMLIFLAAGWAFTKNYENVIDRLNAESSIRDETGRLSDEDKAFLREFESLLRRRFGQEFRLRVFQDEIVRPTLDSRTLFVGLSPARREVAIEFPELVLAALGRDFAANLAREVFAPAFERGDWPKALREAVTEVWARLTLPPEPAAPEPPAAETPK